ncbi:MAG: hypothetical protein ACSLFL_06930 [Alphaproteobacteria bacterium]
MPHSITSLNPAQYTGIAQMLHQASVRTGTGFDHLINTAMRESSLDSSAKASTSSASGMFQFIEQTWLGMVKQHGAEHGLKAQANAIFQDSNGRYKVPDQDMRREILALRQDTKTSALMAGELTNDNRKVLERKLDREVSGGELYAAHVLGASGAARLISAAEQDPSGRAASLFPAAARANQGIFYEKGRARTVAEVTEFLTTKGTPPSATPKPVYAANTPNPAQNYPASYTPGYSASGGNSLAGLGHNAQILSPDMIAIMASLDVPGSSRSDRTGQYKYQTNSFGLTG